MESPIIVDERGDLDFFRSVEDAERYLEPIDIKNQEFDIFDATGRRLMGRVIEKKRRLFGGLWKPTFEAVSLQPTDLFEPNELGRRLVRFLLKLGEGSEASRDLSLPELLEECESRVGYTR